MLGEVAQLHVRMHAALSGEDRQFADEGLDQGRLAGAIRAKQANAISRLEAESDLAENPDVAITGIDLVEPGKRVRQLERIGEIDADLALGTDCFGSGQLGQALDPRLRLLGFRRRGLEAVDERLQVGALGLFLLEGDLLLAQLLGALALEAGVVAGVEPGRAVMQMQHVRADAIEELAVVRDHHQHARILEQPLFEPEHGIEVEMVGGFVEQEQVARHHQRPRQIEAHAPATGKLGDCALVRIGRKAKPVQQLAGTCGGVITVDLGHLLVRGGDRIPILGRHRGFLGHQHRMHLGIAGDDEIDGGIRQRGRFLGNAGNAQLRRFFQITGIRLDLAKDGGKQTGLAAAVAADHADAPTGMQGDVDPGQEQAFAAPQGEIAKGNHASCSGMMWRRLCGIEKSRTRQCNRALYGKPTPKQKRGNSHRSPRRLLGFSFAFRRRVLQVRCFSARCERASPPKRGQAAEAASNTEAATRER